MANTMLNLAGALVLLKWDHERSSHVCTVAITRQDTDFVRRRDTDQIAATLFEALTDYRSIHEKPNA
jgi:hypothetical protein